MQQPSLSITLQFLLSSQSLFQITYQSPKTTTIKQLLSHTIKTISMDIKQNPEVLFLPSKPDSLYVFGDQNLQQKILLDTTVGQVIGKLFYHFTKEQYDMLMCDNFQRKNRPVKQMKSDHMAKRFRNQNVKEEPFKQQHIGEPLKEHTRLSMMEQTKQSKQSQLQKTEKIRQDTYKIKPFLQQTKLIQENQVLSQPKTEVKVSVLPQKGEMKVINQSPQTKNQSVYFQNQSNLDQINSKAIHPIPIPYHELQQTHQKQIQQEQFHSQSVEQVKSDACCQLI